MLRRASATVKDVPKHKGDAVKLAKDLLARAEKEEKGDDPRIYYYLAERLSVHVRDETIDAFTVVEKALKAEFDKLKTAAEAERVALIAWEEIKVDLERAKKKHAEWESQHDERMLPEVRRIQQGLPKTPPPPGNGGAGGGQSK